MDYTGFLPKFKLNRPLTDEERALQLKQSQRLDVEPVYQAAVIRINSTYLETTDKFYGWVGWLTIGMLLVSGVLLWGLGLFYWTGYTKVQLVQLRNGIGLQDIYALLFVTALFGPLLWVCIWGLKIECFRQTHYPIRFNRKTRMVHAFRLDGTVLSARWDDLFFTLGRGNRSNFMQNWDIRVHVLGADRTTVLDTFTLGNHIESQDILREFWEMHRRYMEDGPQAVSELIKIYMPIQEKRETFYFGVHRFLASFGASTLALLLFGPLMPFFGSARWLAMRTSKIPVWPAEVDAQCAIEPGDKYERDARNNPSDMYKIRLISRKPK